ncbi:uncharacterized protein LOC121969430 [Zingiber officinale]|uniref:uncharacterized protein LOC121969430 n=1 Tax=Zingiber officinale TaxID=94328 RepID=UPI001C4BA035|nr:uncharacterized protein LOC121969430 [Zingiber officinale]XP_042375468.1 uncharacterized protein LOC121969430 [Zingiber officinale]
MPPGPRKRRAAKRKKEMEERMKTPSPSDSPRDAGQSEDRVPHEGGEEADRQSPSPTISSEEWFGSDAADSAAADSSKNPKGEDLVEEDGRELAPAVKEVAFRPDDESAAKSNELAESEKESSKPAVESTISVDNAIDLTERSQATEFAAGVLEETSGDNTERAEGVFKFNHDGDGHQVAGGDETSPATEVKQAAAEVLDGEKESQLPDVDVAVKHEGDGRQAAAGDEALPATELPHRSPPVGRRTNQWWNCCGLLDFFHES